MLSNNKKFLLFFLYVVCVLFFIFRANPKLFSTDPAKADKELSPSWETARFNTSNSDKNEAGPIHFYRQSFGRQANYKLIGKPDLLESLWKSPEINVGIHSASKASIALDNERLYVGSDTSWFYAFSLEGKLIWKFYSGSAFQGVHSTAAVDDDTVYFGSYRGTLYALDKITGNLRWMKILGHTIGASITPKIDCIMPPPPPYEFAATNNLSAHNLVAP